VPDPINTRQDSQGTEGPAEVPAPGAPGAPDEATVADGPQQAPTAQEEEIARLRSERDEYLDTLRRTKAEFDNYRKRAERERRATIEAGARDVVADLLPVMDNLERALLAMEGADPGIVVGVEMVRQQLAALLDGRGVTEIEAHELPFDPTVHEAVVSSPSQEHEEGTVMAVVEKGYRLRDTVLRPARVVVAAGRGG
jgi:molecular chaperone GrpE